MPEHPAIANRAAKRSAADLAPGLSGDVRDPGHSDGDIRALDNPESGPITFDLDSARRRMDHDESLLKAMLGFFTGEVPTLVAQVDEAVGNGNVEAAARPIHTIKTHCANFGVSPCHPNIVKLETFAKGGDLVTVRRVWPEVRQGLMDAVHIVDTEFLTS